MARKASRFKVGLFVIVGLAMGLAALVYLGASSYGEGADTYVTYFNQSVQGLSRDSVVKYLGVDVGRVTDIRVAPDHNLIEVVMDIKFKGELGTNMVAQLKMAGITGLSFIELDRQQEDEDDLSPPA
jgi:phospholipid/cholesterol/gamma-HCH transport system substrate-binding protein